MVIAWIFNHCMNPVSFSFSIVLKSLLLTLLIIPQPIQSKYIPKTKILHNRFKALETWSLRALPCAVSLPSWALFLPAEGPCLLWEFEMPGFTYNWAVYGPCKGYITCLHVYTYIYIRAYIYMYIYIYTHTHIVGFS